MNRQGFNEQNFLDGTKKLVRIREITLIEKYGELVAVPMIPTFNNGGFLSNKIPNMIRCQD